ncbi:LytR family transcriptional attenuator [Actinocorallia herbida]|uniref:LytR family transcriptional attenuator n=1 Tax=Actinocorallia herbida TaxID=58109 RepID=A0A3N1D9H3_9ACTN|nr:LCP family protein [Actinocorallia herbida]ROO90175.1 LytR family transcriptional attenuator [Actinocorallia herbida]
MKRTIWITLASAAAWGTAHFLTGRRVVGALLLALQVALAVGVLVLVGPLADDATEWFVQPQWLNVLRVGIVATGAIWAAVIVRSYQLVSTGRPVLVGFVIVLCLAVAAPLAYAVELTRVSQDLVNDVFAKGTKKNPFNGVDRINLLLIGADAAPNRPGVRTDSMTVASIDTRKGTTTLFSLPRNLEDVPMPTPVSQAAFPDGFQGDGAGSPGLLNEVFQWAEDHPDIVPGVADGKRGPDLLKDTVGGVLGLQVDYYVMVDMAGFAQLVDAVGGVRINVAEELVYGKQSQGRIPAGDQILTGEQALWFGRTRTNSDDYNRMGRQKCLLYALSQQADPGTLLTRFHGIAGAAKRAVSTDLPSNALPGLIRLSKKIRGKDVRSVQFVPPLISTAYPDWELIRAKVTETLAAKPAPAKKPTAVVGPAAATTAPETPAAEATATEPAEPDSLATTCG